MQLSIWRKSSGRPGRNMKRGPQHSSKVGGGRCRTWASGTVLSALTACCGSTFIRGHGHRDSKCKGPFHSQKIDKLVFCKILSSTRMPVGLLLMSPAGCPFRNKARRYLSSGRQSFFFFPRDRVHERMRSFDNVCTATNRGGPLFEVQATTRPVDVCVGS